MSATHDTGWINPTTGQTCRDALTCALHHDHPHYVLNATTNAGGTIPIIGRIDTTPRHPARGTSTTAFTTHPDLTPATCTEVLYALVSVNWATEFRSVDPHTGFITIKYIPGLIGAPVGTSWYLHPVSDHGRGHITLENSYGRGHFTATLPPIPGTDAPRKVPIHDYPVTLL